MSKEIKSNFESKEKHPLILDFYSSRNNYESLFDNLLISLDESGGKNFGKYAFAKKGGLPIFEFTVELKANSLEKLVGKRAQTTLCFTHYSNSKHVEEVYHSSTLPFLGRDIATIISKHLPGCNGHVSNVKKAKNYFDIFFSYHHFNSMHYIQTTFTQDVFSGIAKLKLASTLNLFSIPEESFEGIVTDISLIMRDNKDVIYLENDIVHLN